MARSYANITTSIWQDPEFRALPANAQRLYFMLLTQADISSCGVLAMTVKRWAGNASDTDEDAVREALRMLIDTHYVVVDWDREEVLVRTFIKWDGGYKVPKRLAAIVKSASAVQSSELVQVIASELDKVGVPHTLTGGSDDSLSNGYRKGIDTPGVVVTRVVSTKQPTTHNPQPGGQGLSDSPPAEHCSKHSNGTDDPCGACGRARRRREQWESERRKSAAEFAEYLKSQPECPHGIPGGDIDRPNTSTPSCAQCRRQRREAS